MYHHQTSHSQPGESNPADHPANNLFSTKQFLNANNCYNRTERNNKYILYYKF